MCDHDCGYGYTEEWEFLFGGDFYEVSNHGRVISWAPTVHHRLKGLFRRETGYFMSLNPPSGYAYIMAPSGPNGKYRKRSIHSLVLEGFVGPRPEGMPETRHINGIKTDNHLLNIEYCTYQQNQDDRKRLGEAPIGEDHYSAKMTDAKVLELREVYATDKYTQEELATVYGIKGRTVSQIVRGQTWKHVGGPLTFTGWAHGKSTKGRNADTSNRS